MITEAQARAAAVSLDVDFTLADAEVVKSAYKTLAKTHHPDMGGDMAKFVEVDRAKHVLLKWLERKPAEDTTFRLTKCAVCNGIGRVTIRRGFASMTIVCGRCRGSGDAQFEPDVTGE